MSVVKVIELIGESKDGWEAATQLCLEDAAKTVRNIKSIWVKDLEAIVDSEQIKSYRVTCKISFLIDESRRHPT